MMRAVAVSLCLMLPGAAFAEEPSTPPAPAADQPSAAPALTPQDPAAPAPEAVEQARWCGAHGGCGGGRGKGKFLIVGVAGTVLTAVAIGVAVGVATHKQGNPITP